MHPFLPGEILFSAVGLSDGVGGDDVLAFCAGGITILTFYFLLQKTPPWVGFMEEKKFRKQFRMEWSGWTSDDGHVRIPGMMERMSKIDGEFQKDGNGSLKTQVLKAVAAIEDVKVDVAAVKETVESMVSPTAGGEDNRINIDGGSQ